MARNVVQFQKGLNEPAFEQQYGTEEQCRAIVIASRWPRGFECPACGGRQYCVVTTRDPYQCANCRRQTSPIAGTIFAIDATMWEPAPGAAWHGFDHLAPGYAITDPNKLTLLTPGFDRTSNDQAAKR